MLTPDENTNLSNEQDNNYSNDEISVENFLDKIIIEKQKKKKSSSSNPRTTPALVKMLQIQ